MLLTAARSLARIAIMSMDMRGADGDGVLELHMSFEPLAQSASLGNVERHPAPVLILLGIDVIGWQSLESSIKRVNLILILFAGLAGPIDERGRRGLGMMATTQ